MSTHTHKDTLASYTRDASYGPTRTKTVQVRFEQNLRGVLGRINAAIREGIIEDDVLNLQEETDTLEVDDPGPFETDDSQAALVKFVQWIRNQLDEEFLTVVSNDENQFIRRAYAEGIRFATSQLQEADVPIQSVAIDEILEEGRFRRGLQTLYTRTYENLESVADDVVSDVRDTLTEGYRDGLGPREIANNLTDRVDSVGKHRATMIARSEVINATTQGTLDRYEEATEIPDVEMGVRHVGRLTAMDDDVCTFCRLTGDEVFTIDEFRGTRTLFNGQTYRLRPPSHPNGRCAVVPEIGVTQDDLAPLSERVPGELIL